MRRLIVCIEGTWNAGSQTNTNVWRVATEGIAPTGPTGVPQKVVYVPGVGTRGLVDKLFGGIWGKGVSAQIREAYLAICAQYQPGDELSFFGYSRGAFAIRILTIVIANIGILKEPNSELAEKAISYARQRLTHDQLREIQQFANDACHPYPGSVRFVGVWDTVVRYGPFFAPFQIAFQRFRHDQTLKARIPVMLFRHALALDETRVAFEPWRATAEQDNRFTEEVWFPGNHSDLGGVGRKFPGLCELPFQWICEGAEQSGLAFQLDFVRFVKHDEPPVLPKRSTEGIWRFLPSRPRVVRPSDVIAPSVGELARKTGYKPAAKLP